MDDRLIQNGVDLMLFGMGSVLVFLALLALASVVMSSIVRRWFPEAEGLETLPDRAPGAGTSKTAKVDDNVMAAIKAAIEQHRAKRR